MVSSDEARDALAAHAGHVLKPPAEDRCAPELQILTLLKGNQMPTKIGNGYTHALAWRLCPAFWDQTVEAMEGLVDARSERVYRFVDTIEYFHAEGSVYPVTNEGGSPLGVQTVAVKDATPCFGIS